jgi:hypothetical protein
MDTTQFNHLMRALTLTPTRRDVARALTGLTLSGAIASVWGNDAEAKKKKRKKCGPCQTKKKGKCKGAKPDDTTCNGDGKCFAGACIPRPTCLASASACTQPAAGACCSGICSAAHGDLCLFSDPGQPCYTGSDCNGAPLTPCIAYRCR